MNSFLAQVGPTTNENVGQSKKTSKYYLKKHSKANTESILLGDVSEKEVVEVCSKLNPKTSKDSYGFAQNIVLGDIDIMAPVVARFVNCSQKTGICPDDSKIARVIPVYKNKENKHD